MKHDNELPAGFFARLDIDFVSDQDYLQEFKNGYTGFRGAEAYFSREFGRSLDDYNDPVRLNRFSINRLWYKYSLNAELNWYDNVINRRQEDTDTTVQELPVIQFTGSKQRLWESPIYFSMENEYTHFYRANTTTPNSITQSHRVDVYPRIYWPLNLSYYLAVEPSFGIRETFWQVAEYEDQPDDMQDDETFFRDLYDWRLDLSTEVYNIFQTSGSQIDRIKHAVKPQIVYTYIPEEDQDVYPQFDALDRIAKQNQLTYSLTNLLTYRSLKDRPKKSGNFSEDPQYHYQQFVRFYLEQSYDFNEAAENDPAEWKNGETQEPFSTVYGKLEISPKRFFSSTVDAEWHPYESDIISRNIAADITDHQGNRLFLEHRYKKDLTETSPDGLESIYSKLQLQLTKELSVFGEYEKDLYADTDLLTGIGTLYKAQCWSLQLKYTREIDVEDYSFMIGLHGLGEFESDIQ
jgi:LPS-assembly protein